MEVRRHLKNNKEKYEGIHRKIRKLCKEAKEIWLEEIARKLNTNTTPGILN